MNYIGLSTAVKGTRKQHRNYRKIEGKQERSQNVLQKKRPAKVQVRLSAPDAEIALRYMQRPNTSQSEHIRRTLTGFYANLEERHDTSTAADQPQRNGRHLVFHVGIDDSEQLGYSLRWCSEAVRLNQLHQPAPIS